MIGEQFNTLDTFPESYHSRLITLDKTLQQFVLLYKLFLFLFKNNFIEKHSTKECL